MGVFIAGLVVGFSIVMAFHLIITEGFHRK